MKYICLAALSVLLVSNVNAQSYKKIHNKAILADTHNDILTACFEDKHSFDQNLKGKTHSDVKRFKEGGVDVQVFSIWCDGNKVHPYSYANEQIDTLLATAARSTKQVQIVKTPEELFKAIRKKKIASMMGVEGGHMIENDLSKLDALYNRGVRYMTLTWNNSTSWATSAMYEASPSPSVGGEQRRKGLSDFGKQIVRRMNKLGMMVDISHVGEQTFWDAINTTTKPVIASHSSVYTICPVFRNLKDDQIKAIGKNNGVIFLNFYSGFLDSGFMRRSQIFNQAHKTERDSILKINPEQYFADEYLFEKYKDEVQALRPPLSLLIDHLDYIVKLVGVNHVGMGSDFDGISSTPKELDDVTNYPLVTKELLERGYSTKDIQKILGGNFIRVFKANAR